MLEYNRKKRITSINALLHPYFNDVRKYQMQVNGITVQSLFEFTEGRSV